MSKIYSLIITALLLTLMVNCHHEPVNYMNETKELKDARMEWWREARFGMLLNFVY